MKNKKQNNSGRVPQTNKFKKKTNNSGQHIISIKDFSSKFIIELFKLSKKIKLNPNKYSGFLLGKIFATLFYEPSTRTRLSFESAINKLGGRVISVENAKESSSANKGETLEDTISTVANYADCIVLRHFADDSAQRARNVSSVPIVNAGSGKVEHPTQAFLDAFTIYEKFGRLNNLNICISGDLFRGRTVYSLVYLLSKFGQNKFIFVSRENSKINTELRKYLATNNVKFVESGNLPQAVANADILYVTRIQRERCKNLKEYNQAKKGMRVDKNILDLLPVNAIIMHPLPRVDEISSEVDQDRRAWYFKQVGNGVFVRMALLINIFS
jgi:aspartate carbamoyltransferase catalytic subunit